MSQYLVSYFTDEIDDAVHTNIIDCRDMRRPTDEDILGRAFGVLELASILNRPVPAWDYLVVHLGDRDITRRRYR